MLAVIWCRIFCFFSELHKKLNIKTHINIILPVVFYGFETWSHTLRDERRVRVFENILLRRIFGLMIDRETGEWRKLQNKEPNYQYSSNNIVQVIKIDKNNFGWACSACGGEVRRGVHRILLGTYERKRRLGRHRHRWVYNITVDLE